MKLDDWLEAKKAEVLRKWKANEIGLAEAASELYRIGIPAHEAWDILART